MARFEVYTTPSPTVPGLGQRTPKAPYIFLLAQGWP